MPQAAHAYWTATVDVWDVTGGVNDHVGTAPPVTEDTLQGLIQRVSGMLREAYPNASDEIGMEALTPRIPSIRVSRSRHKGNTAFRIRFSLPPETAGGIKSKAADLMVTCSIARRATPDVDPKTGTPTCPHCGKHL